VNEPLAARDFKSSFLAAPPRGNGSIAGALPLAVPAHEPDRGIAWNDGRYAGGSPEIWIELRLDLRECGIVSGDLYRLQPDSRHYVASFRTASGGARENGSWPIVGQDEHDRRVEGRLWLEPLSDPPDSLSGRIRFEGPLEGIPPRRSIPFALERLSSAFRTLGLEIESEEGVESIRGYPFSDRLMTIEEALAHAGIATYVTGIPDRIPRAAATGWEMAQLHALMSDLAQAPLHRRAWEIHMLILSYSDRAGLLGIMFDSSDNLPRQGTAIFADEIREIPGVDHDRKILQTAVHELGHALNLVHRFERVVGRADSPSFMNYDWRYRGGKRSDEFWNQFRFAFDRDELEFLRHSPLPPLIPGGAPFHSVSYWADGNGGYSPYVPEVPLMGWELTLTPPEGGTLLDFAQPVYVRLMLTNRSRRTVDVPRFLLDPKAGFTEIVIRRVHGGAFVSGGSQPLSFVPTMQRCFQWSARDDLRLAHGESLEDNANLTFGSAGFAFAEPGTYDVTALLVIFDEESQRELVVRSNTVRIRIGTPRSREEERQAMDFFTEDVGLYLALGGSPALPRARQALSDIAGRRRRDRKDPLVAHIERAAGFDAQRSYVRFQDGRFQVTEARMEEAVAHFQQIPREPIRAFDSHTARLTREVASGTEAIARGEAPPDRRDRRHPVHAVSKEQTDQIVEKVRRECPEPPLRRPLRRR
jgi:hypothetical protein